MKSELDIQIRTNQSCSLVAWIYIMVVETYFDFFLCMEYFTTDTASKMEAQLEWICYSVKHLSTDTTVKPVSRLYVFK